MATPLTRDDVHVWCRTTAVADEATLAPALALLSAKEQARAARFMQADDRIDYVLAHALLRDTLSRYADVRPAEWQFDVLPTGKPQIAAQHGTALSFSLSHTRGLAACAVGLGCDVGVDVESLTHQADVAIEQLALAASERQIMGDCAADYRSQRLIEFWTLKEAYLKATGEGLRVPPDQVAFDRRDDGTMALASTPAETDTSWRFALFIPTVGYTVAVAARRRGAAPHAIRLHPLV